MIAITDVRFSPAQSQDIERGLLGYVVLRYGELEVCAVVRRSVNGRRYLSFPGRSDATGQRRDLVRPVDQAARDRLEHQVLEAIGLQERARG